MELYSLAAVLLALRALASVFNPRILRLPETIGLMATGLIASVVLLLVGLIFPGPAAAICQRVVEFDFSMFVLDFAKASSVDILISLATVMEGYALSHWLHVSGPLAMVVVGLMFGLALRSTDASERRHLDNFWEGIDQVISDSYTFPNADGHQLAVRLDLPPVKKPRAYALFSHCFTCSKGIRSAAPCDLTLVLDIPEARNQGV